MAKNMLNSWLPDLQLIAAPKSAPMELTLDIPMLLETMMSPMIQLQQPDLKFKLASPANSPSIIELLFQLSCQPFLLLLFKHQGNTAILYGFLNLYSEVNSSSAWICSQEMTSKKNWIFPTMMFQLQRETGFILKWISEQLLMMVSSHFLSGRSAVRGYPIFKYWRGCILFLL